MTCSMPCGLSCKRDRFAERFWRALPGWESSGDGFPGVEIGKDGGGGLVVLQHEAGSGAGRGLTLRTWADRTRPVRHILGRLGQVERGGPLRLSAEADEGARRSSCPRAGTSRAESGKQPDPPCP